MGAIIRLAEWLNTGESIGQKTWPPSSSDEARIQDYKRYMAIFDGDHVNALNDRYELGRYGFYVTCNIGGLVVRAINDLLFGEELGLVFPEGTSSKQEQRVYDIWERSHGQQMLMEFGPDTMVAGDGILLPILKDGKAYIEPANVTTWFPDLDPDDTRKVHSHVFAWERVVGSGAGKKEYLRMMVHTPGQIENMLWLKSGNKLVKQVGLDTLYEPGEVFETVDTGLDEMLPLHVPNHRTARSYFGRGEYLGLESLFSSVNAHLTQTSWQIAKHSDPILGMTEEQFNAVVKENGEFDRHLLDAVFFGMNGEVPQYVTWDGKTQDAIAFVGALVDNILMVTETARQLVGLDAGGGAESGRALKYRLLRTLAKVNRKRAAYSYAIPKALELAQRLEGEKKPVSVTIKWPDGLPQDQLEDMEYLERRRANRTITRVEMVKRLDNLDAQDAEKMIKEVDAETVAEDDADRTALNERLGRRQPPEIKVALGAEE